VFTARTDWWTPLRNWNLGVLALRPGGKAVAILAASDCD
jgi:hypothetical protein